MELRCQDGGMLKSFNEIYREAAIHRPSSGGGGTTTRRRLFLPSELYPFDSLSELPRGVSEFKMLMADTDNNNRHSPLSR